MMVFIYIPLSDLLKYFHFHFYGNAISIPTDCMEGTEKKNNQANNVGNTRNVSIANAKSIRARRSYNRCKFLFVKIPFSKNVKIAFLWLLRFNYSAKRYF